MLFFIAIVFTDGEPLDRAAERVGARGDKACKRWSHLWTESDLSPAFVLEIEKLLNDFLT